MRTVMVLSATIGLLLTSCKKNNDPGHDNDEQEDPLLSQPVAGQLKVYFDKSTVDFSRYDSGFAILQREGTVNQYMKRFVKEKDFLKIDIDDLEEGKYRLMMYLDVKLKNGDKTVWRQFRYEKDIQILHSGIALKGPVNELKKDWKIYAVLSDAAKTFHLTIPLDCTDPYFELSQTGGQWEYIYLERAGYNKGSDGSKTLLGAAAFECQEGDCTDNHGNRADSETFRDWSAMIGTKQWNSGEFFVMVLNEDTGKDLVFNHVFDIPDLQ
jgi:hypothetical protein